MKKKPKKTKINMLKLKLNTNKKKKTPKNEKFIRVLYYHYDKLEFILNTNINGLL